MRFVNTILGLVTIWFVVACVGAFQASQLQVPVWMGNRYTFPLLGPTLVVGNGQLNVAKERFYGVDLSFDQVDLGRKAAILPVGASKVVTHLNGLKQKEGKDYEIKGGLLVQLWVWPVEVGDYATVDFDKPL